MYFLPTVFKEINQLMTQKYRILYDCMALSGDHLETHNGFAPPLKVRSCTHFQILVCIYAEDYTCHFTEAQ